MCCEKFWLFFHLVEVADTSVTPLNELVDSQAMFSTDDEGRDAVSLTEGVDRNATLPSPMDGVDDRYDYMLAREARRMSEFADHAINKNPLMEFCQAERCVRNIFYLPNFNFFYFF